MTVAGLSPTEQAQGARNPYVGPRPFRPDETMHGRDREARELVDLVCAQRIVLLHAPSGAGKTSLIQAGLTPLLREEKFTPTPALRVNVRAPRGQPVRNHYVYSVASYLLGSERSAKEIAGLTLTDVINVSANPKSGKTPILVLDQFEEILVLDPTDDANQKAFFSELGQALADTGAWALLSMREDYIGGLKRFERYIPGHLAARYRLGFLGHGAAQVAIQRPAEEHGVAFADDAAEYLVRQLAKVKVQDGDRQHDKEAPYVQPFQLQVVCRKLWRSVRKHKETRGRFRGISLKDVKKHVDIAGALQSYYSGVVNAVAEKTATDEAVIRRWFETELITPQELRTQTLTGPEVAAGHSKEILQELERVYLIRSDTRQESTWYELSHDKLIAAVLVDNESWFRPRLQPWQLAAREWAENRDSGRLLRGLDLEAAHQSRTDEPTHVESEFLRASEEAERSGVLGRMRTRLGMAILVAAVEFLVILALLAVLLFG